MRNLHEIPRERENLWASLKGFSSDDLVAGFETMRRAAERLQASMENFPRLTGINGQVYLDGNLLGTTSSFNFTPTYGDTTNILYGIPITTTALNTIPRTQEFTFTGTYRDAVLAENPIQYWRLGDEGE